jgi:hypothetical protein
MARRAARATSVDVADPERRTDRHRERAARRTHRSTAQALGLALDSGAAAFIALAHRVTMRIQKVLYLGVLGGPAHPKKSGSTQGETWVASWRDRRNVVAVKRAWGAAAAEFTRVFGAVSRRARDRGPWGFALAIGLCVAIAAVSAVDSRHGSQHLVNSCCNERDGYPLHVWLARLLGSMIAPPPGLPIWGSLLQVLVVVGIAEAVVGRTWTIAVGLAGHVLSGISARLLLNVVPGVFGGLPAIDRFVLDTGPSAVTVALTAYLALVLRVPILGSLAAAGVVLAMFAHSDLAAREHAVAWIVGMACGGLHLLILRRRAAHASMRDIRGLGTSVAGRA